MKRPFKLVSPDRLRIQQGGGCLSVFGLPFFVAGVFMALTAIGLVPMLVANRLTRPLLALLGIVFTAVGGVLVFGRHLHLGFEDASTDRAAARQSSTFRGRVCASASAARG